VRIILRKGRARRMIIVIFLNLSTRAILYVIRGMTYWFLGSVDFKIMGIGKMMMARLVMILRIPVVMRLA
jgi:hypothetical protein